MIKNNITLTLNKEYTYQQICEELGWKVYKGDSKVRQIKAIEESFEFYHPENKYTHKPKKSYIFTKQLKELQLVDRRHENKGGCREGSGMKSEFQDDEFTYLFTYLLADCKNHLFKDNYVYFPNTKLYKSFGFYYVDAFNKLGENLDSKSPEYKMFHYIFKNVVFNTLKDLTFTKVCRKVKAKRNSLPKGLIYVTGHGKYARLDVLDDYEMDSYKEIEEEFRMDNELTSEFEVFSKGKKKEEIIYIEKRMKSLYGYECVRKVNKILLTDELLEQVNNFKYDSEKVREYQKHLFEIMCKRVRKKLIDYARNADHTDFTYHTLSEYHCCDNKILEEELLRFMDKLEAYGEDHFAPRKPKENTKSVSSLEETKTTSTTSSVQEVIPNEPITEYDESYPQRDYDKLSFTTWFVADDELDMLFDISSLDDEVKFANQRQYEDRRKPKKQSRQEYLVSVYG